MFVVAFSVMTSAQADTVVPPGSGDTNNLEIGPNLGGPVGEVSLVAIGLALAISVGLLLSSLGPRGLTMLTTIGNRGR